eukprot:CAMPEP_0117649142 /NCGR_PEP_ID=MMETSP0804-20121206/806_1 /TAXON_ID=1074897 /ORGANISM="Tetraselmis astigmatica, Strain CCMP880" /LENGTH=719 /DNA_ID=CAMNT_0005454843 /DNA_START=32 /DNA_END=2191 /DNA_ORIENTATION=-
MRTWIAAVVALSALSGGQAQVTKEVLAAAIPVFQSQLVTGNAQGPGPLLYNSLLADLSGRVAPGTHATPESDARDEDPALATSAGQFKWVYGIWHCSAHECGRAGYLVREAKCVDSTTLTTVGDSSCSSGPMLPLKSVACKTPACQDDVQWVPAPWGYCSKDCGGGLMNRTVDCLSAMNTIEPSSRCSERDQDRPAHSQPCNTHKCKASLQPSETTPGVDEKEQPDLWMMSRDDDSSSSEESSSDQQSSSSGKQSSSDSSSERSSSSSSSADDDNSSGASGGSRSSSGQCGRCRSGSIGPWFLEKRLWYQVAWQGQKICFKGCYKHEDARSGKTHCASSSGAPKGGCKQSNIVDCKKWSGCHDDEDYFIPTCATCKYIGLNRKAEEASQVAPSLGSCLSEVISSNHTCCPMGSTIDKDGACCESGRLDSCGSCDGNAKTVDVLGRCCSAELAADGLCCTEGVDECGVCGGLGTTCGMAVTVRLSSDSSLEFEKLVRHTVPARMASTLGPGMMATSELGVELGASSREGTGFQGLVTYTTPPLPGTTPKGVAYDVSGIGMVEKVAYAGVCGNSICEVGEQTRAIGQGTCEADCPFPQMLECQCGSHGVCRPTSGVCECFAGYQGDWCQQCATNFTSVAGACVPRLDTASLEGGLPTAVVEGPPKGKDSQRMMDLLTVLLAVLSVAMATTLGAIIALHVFVRSVSRSTPQDKAASACKASL